MLADRALNVGACQVRNAENWHSKFVTPKRRVFCIGHVTTIIRSEPRALKGTRKQTYNVRTCAMYTRNYELHYRLFMPRKGENSEINWPGQDSMYVSM
jgi:hypothetical protein